MVSIYRVVTENSSKLMFFSDFPWFPKQDGTEETQYEIWFKEIAKMKKNKTDHLDISIDEQNQIPRFSLIIYKISIFSLIIPENFSDPLVFPNWVATLI